MDFFLERFPLIVSFFTFSDPDLKLDDSPLKIKRKRNVFRPQGQKFFAVDMLIFAA